MRRTNLNILGRADVERDDKLVAEAIDFLLRQPIEVHGILEQLPCYESVLGFDAF